MSSPRIPNCTTSNTTLSSSSSSSSVNGASMKVMKQASKRAIQRAYAKKGNPETEMPSGQTDPELVNETRTFLHQGPESETPTGTGGEKFIDYIGDTPMIELTHMVSSFKSHDVRVFAKAEFFNPGFSIKDRIVQNIFNRAEECGKLRPGMTIVAASSGNTGASTAMIAAMKGYKCIITTSPKCSKEKRDAITAYGATLLVSKPGAKEGEPEHYMDMARLLALEDPDKYFDVDQYECQYNPQAHYMSLGPEIFQQTAGTVTHFVAGGSTGGTISGVSSYLKEENPHVRAVLADPVGSIFTNFFHTGKVGEAKKFLCEGVGKGSIPGAMNFGIIDEVISVSDQEAFAMCHRLAREEGILSGGSSGLNVFAALKLASEVEEPSVICTVMPDMGVKYLSKIYSDEWLEENNITIPTIPRMMKTLAEDFYPEHSVQSIGQVQAIQYKDIVGDTPLIDISNLVENPENPNVKVFAKCEFFQPSFSIKDRITQNIFEKAEEAGELRSGMTVVAASSGNTAASTAMLCAIKGYDCIITTSPKCSQEKMNAIKAYGAKLLVSKPGAKEGTPDHYMDMARNLALENPEKYFDVDQYDCQRNPQGHYLSLGPEIYEQTSGSVTHFIVAGSTGGTISGTGKYLKEQNENVQIILADPVGSIFTPYFKNGTYDKPRPFTVEGVGKGSIPGALNIDVIDDVMPITDQEAYSMCHHLARNEGILAGGSSGLNVCAALRLASTIPADHGPATIVTVLPDLGVKYLSKVYNDEWLLANGLNPPN